MKGVRAVVECGTCGRVTRGVPVPVDETPEMEDEEITEILRRVVGGLIRAKGYDLVCPGCGVKVFSHGTRLFLVYDDGKVH